MRRGSRFVLSLLPAALAVSAALSREPDGILKTSTVRVDGAEAARLIVTVEAAVPLEGCRLQAETVGRLRPGLVRSLAIARPDRGQDLVLVCAGAGGEVLREAIAVPDPAGPRTPPARHGAVEYPATTGRP